MKSLFVRQISKPNYIYSNINPSAIGSKPDKAIVTKKDDSNFAHSSRGGSAPINRGKPQPNAQPTIKPTSQTVVAPKPVGTNAKPTPNVNQTQPPVSDQNA